MGWRIRAHLGLKLSPPRGLCQGVVLGTYGRSSKRPTVGRIDDL
ncbi:hypothetical protein HMPREF1556_01777, partial [Porphyromonas sp. oral taxon 278 str. W7784]